MRRVAYVCTDPGIPVFGSKGASVHVQAVLRVLADRGVELTVLTPRPGGRPPAGLEDVRVVSLPEVGGGEPVQREARARQSDAAVAAALDALGPLDLVYERYALWGRTATAWAGRAGVPSVLEVNAPLVAEQRAHRALADVEGAEQVAREALGAAGTVVCVSEPVADWARATSRRPERVHVVANGVDVARATPSDRPVAPPTGPFTVGFVGTLKPWHGVEVLVEAAALLAARDDDLRLLVVGAGPQREALEQQARRAGIAHRVELTGAVTPADVPAQLHRMDVAVAPYPDSPDAYFSPLKVYEYLAAGLPVVASRVGQLPQLLQDGALGVLVPPGDPLALAGAVAALRADPARRQALALAGRAATEREHTWESVVDRVLALVRLDLGEPARAGVR